MTEATLHHQRRFIVKAFDPDVIRAPSKRIEQGYLNNMPGYMLRIRLEEDGDQGVIARKYGTGITRELQETRVGADTARFMLDSCPYRIAKRRYFRPPWCLDLYERELSGLAVAEVVLEHADADWALPPWITDAYECTDSLTSLHLAKMARNLDEGDSHQIRERLPVRVPRIVLTGAPCSGKSTAMRRLKEDLGSIVHSVPEVASIVIAQVGISPPFDDPFMLRRFQQTIYKVQTTFQEVSEMTARREGKHALLLDRGTVDNAAYLKGGLDEFEAISRTNRAYEFSQYDLVVCLDVPPEGIYQEMASNNPARSEPYEEAVALGERFVLIWSEHPNMTRIRSSGSWDEKYAAIRHTIVTFIEECRRSGAYH